MSISETKVIVVLNSSIKYFENPKGTEKNELHNYVQKYATDLIVDLALPTKISLDIIFGENDTTLGNNLYYITVNEQKCGIVGMDDLLPDYTILDLARSIQKVIYRNRDLFLTSTLSDEIYGEWLSNHNESVLSHLSTVEFHKLLTEFVSRSFKIDKAIDYDPKSLKEDKWKTQRIFEEIVSGFGTTVVKVLVNGVYYDKIFDSGEDKKIQSLVPCTPLQEMIDFLQQGLFEELGILVPKVSIDIDESLKDNEFCIQLNDLRLPSMQGLEKDEFLANAEDWVMNNLNLSGIRVINPASGHQHFVIKDRNNSSKVCQKNSLTTWDAQQYIILSLAAEIRRNAGTFLTADIVMYYMDQVRIGFPSLVDAVLVRYDVILLTQILRDLLDEQITIKDIRAILENLLMINGTINVGNGNITILPMSNNLCPVNGYKKEEELEISDYSNYLRIAIKRYISNKYATYEKFLHVYNLDLQLETRIKNLAMQPMTDDEYKHLMEAIRSKIENLSTNPNFVILVSLEIRKKLRELIKKEFPNLAVLSMYEVVPDVKIKSFGTIT